ncbi:MAG: low molecular weight phosphatase family protein [Euryarchaeota archaeon]|nr:low molecular weight phosphatase family protein [Euryarchaeota archaeon]
MRLLFVCVGNTCRSQMAEAISKEMGHDSYSAGTHPPKNRGVARNALKVLKELDIETAELHPKSIESVDPDGFDLIISMGCGVSCPSLPIDQDWGLVDPVGGSIEEYRKTRDRIWDLVLELTSDNTDA